MFEDLEHAMQAFVELFPRMLILEPQTRRLLEDLHCRGIPTAIVTNGDSNMQKRKVTETSLEV